MSGWRTVDTEVARPPEQFQHQRIALGVAHRHFDSDLSSDGFDTLGGFIYDHLGHVPKTGQRIQVPNFEITILAVEGQRIHQVEMKRIPGDGNGSLNNLGDHDAGAVRD